MKTQQIEIENVDIGELRPDAANPRRIGDEELAALTRSIREFGLSPASRSRIPRKRQEETPRNKRVPQRSSQDPRELLR